MKTREIQRRSFKVSLVLHGVAIMLVLVVPWILKACNRRKPPEKLMFVEFTVSVPPPPAPDTPEPPAPEPPKPKPPEDIPIPEKKPDPPPKKPPEKKPPRDIRQTNRVVRRIDAPRPKDNPLSEAEIAALLKRGASIGDTTSIPDAAQIPMAGYFEHVHQRMYAAWEQPAQLKNLPGLRTVAAITVEPGGRVTARRLARGSGNSLMDDSVMKAVQSVAALRPLPAGQTRPVEIDITFELSD